MASKLETLEKRTKEILRNREQELTDLRNAVTSDRQKAETASQALEAATAANDIEAYRAAKSERELASDLAELHEARTRQLEEKELISGEEYAAARDAVQDEVSAILAANMEKAAGLLAELERLAESDRAIITRANDALLRWQEDVYRDPEVRRNGVIMTHKLAHFELTPVITLSNQIRERGDYQRITGGRA